MKRIILFISVIGLFSLVSCGSKNIDNESSNSNQIIDISSKKEPSENSSSNTDNSSSTPSESKEDVYDDSMPWGELH